MRLPLGDLRSDILAFRERLQALREGYLLVVTPAGKKVTPGYFSCVFEDEHWRRFLARLDKLVSVEKRLTA